MDRFTKEWEEYQAFVKIEPCSEETRIEYKKIFLKYNKKWGDRAYANKAIGLSREFEKTGKLTATREALNYLANMHLIEVYTIRRLPLGYDISHVNMTSLTLDRTITETQVLFDSSRVPHYLWFSSELKEVLLALYLHLKCDLVTYRKAIDTVWAEYAKYTKFECGYSGEMEKLATRLLYCANMAKPNHD